MESLLPLVIQLIGGAAGGNVVGALLKNLNLSKVVATIAGIVGGVGGGQLAGVLGLLTKILGESGASSVLGNGASSAIGGALLTAIVGFIKKAMEPKA